MLFIPMFSFELILIRFLLNLQIEPLSGPLEGGTLITIRGRNLGRRFSDVVNTVKIGNVKCSVLQDRYVVSEE